MDGRDLTLIDRLTHFVGAVFDVNDHCRATIPHYEFAPASAASMEIADSRRFRDLVRELVIINNETIRARYNGTSEGILIGSFAEKGLDFKGSLALDKWFGIGDSSIKIAGLTVYVEEVGGLLTVSRATISAVVDDLYDFSIVAEFPADIAAKIQFGYGAKGELGPAGRLYWNTFNINSTVDFWPVILAASP